MIKTTKWRPDTCECVIEYDWDTDQPAASRAHTSRRVVSRCVRHQSESDLLSALAAENPRKNRVLARISEQFVNVPIEEIIWSFDSNHVLHIATHRNINQARRDAIQAWCDTNIGVGRVIVE